MSAERAAAPTMARYVVARTDEIPEGERLIVEVAGRQVGIFHLDGEFHAILHRCPHLGGPLCLGPVLGLIEASAPGELTFDPSRKFLTCPWHGWEFDIVTGRSYCDPARMRARSIPLQVRSGASLIDSERETGPDVGGREPGPYTAEIIPLSVEDEYIVLTMRAGSPAPTAQPGEPAPAVPQFTSRSEER